jgi:hypothetical protein
MAGLAIDCDDGGRLFLDDDPILIEDMIMECWKRMREDWKWKNK